MVVFDEDDENIGTRGVNGKKDDGVQKARLDIAGLGGQDRDPGI